MLNFTKQGLDIYEQIVPAGRAFEERLMSVMNSQDINDLNRLIDKLMSQAKEL
ncbi:MAG: hypothetical protein HON14_03675 [Rhodospirillaceae bacterium]|nr:hypothetical protein [Rhodospirillaceae bacterium]